MSNATQTQTQVQETPMDHYSLIENLFNDFIAAGGSPKVTEFKRHIDRLIKDKIKPLCSGRGSSAVDGSSWRSVQKARFAGRGAKWQEVSNDELSLTLDRLDDEGFDTADYRSWTEEAGHAWIRYAGPRVTTGKNKEQKNMAAFEVRTVGSTYDCPKSLHYILDEELDDKISPLKGTPHSLKLEVIATKDEVEPSDDTVSDDPVSDETDENYEVQELSASELNPYDDGGSAHAEPPTTDNPEDWEDFLASEGLGADQFDEDGDEDLFGTYEG